MKRLVLLIPTIDRIGGAEQQVLLLARGLAARGWGTTVVALAGAGGAAAAELASAGVGFRSLEMRKGLADARGWLRLHRLLRAEKPDVVHAHLPHAAWMARWSRLFAEVPVVVDTIHTSATGTWGRRAGYRISRRWADAVTAVSASVAEAWSAAGMVAEETLHVVANGIEIEAWQPDSVARAEMRRATGVGDAGFLWLAAGRLEPVKDYPTLLRGFAGLARTTRLVIAGAGPEEAALRRLAAGLGIAERVRFAGFTRGLQRWMSAADGLVLTSLWEGLPMAVLEAGAFGLPVVATDVAGTRDVVGPGTGLLVPARDAAALGAAMRRLMEMTPEARRAMGVEARRTVAERHSLSSVLDRWETLYGELLARSSHGTAGAGRS